MHSTLEKGFAYIPSFCFQIDSAYLKGFTDIWNSCVSVQRAVGVQLSITRWNMVENKK